MEESYKKIIIFDLDGTLYAFKGGSFSSSGLYDVIITNTISYISSRLGKNKLEAQAILDSMLDKYGNSISIGLEKEFKIDHHEYFNFTWKIEPEKYAQFNPDLKEFFLSIKDDFELYLLSDAPMIWIDRVLDYLEIKNFFKDNIFSGEGDARKEFGNAFEKICKTMNVEARDCFVVGDQKETDIIPAKKIGIKTIFIGNNKSSSSDYTIDNILKLKNILKIYE